MSVRPFPWVYPYDEDDRRSDAVVLRPVVAAAAVAVEACPVVPALVDSGSEHVLAAPWVAGVIGVDPAADSHRESALGVGGRVLRVRFVDVRLRLYPPDGDDEHVEWCTEVGFAGEWASRWSLVLGQVGFFDRFTVAMSRYAQHLAVEARETFDGRYGPWYRAA